MDAPNLRYSVCEWDAHLIRIEPVNDFGELIGPIEFIPNRRKQDEPDQQREMKKLAFDSQLESMKRRIRWQTVGLTLHAMVMLVVILTK